jgi:cell division protein FtsZ
MQNGGGALMAIGHGQGENKALSAINQALNHPLLENISLENASGIITNFSGGQDLTLFDVGEALEHIQETVNEDIDIIFGFNNDPIMEDRVQVILIVTGIGGSPLEEALSNVDESVSNDTGDVEAPLLEEVPPPLPIHLASLPNSKIATGDLDLPSFMRKKTRYSETNVKQA